jgi:putative transposase
MPQQYRHDNHSVTLINYHFVFIPKRRRPVLVGEVEQQCRELIHEAAKNIECTVISLEIMPDHVHLFLNCPPTVAPHQIMFRIKGYSSYELRKKFPHLKKMPSMWTRSYFCSTAGNVSSETIKRYIENQKIVGR